MGTASKLRPCFDRARHRAKWNWVRCDESTMSKLGLRARLHDEFPARAEIYMSAWPRAEFCFWLYDETRPGLRFKLLRGRFWQRTFRLGKATFIESKDKYVSSSSSSKEQVSLGGEWAYRPMVEKFSLISSFYFFFLNSSIAFLDEILVNFPLLIDRGSFFLISFLVRCRCDERRPKKAGFLINASHGLPHRFVLLHFISVKINVLIIYLGFVVCWTSD